MSTTTIIRASRRGIDWLRRKAKHDGEQPSRILDRIAANEAIVRENARGGWEIVVPSGEAVGNYATATDAADNALSNGWTVRMERQ